MSATATRLARLGAVPPAYSKNHPDNRNNHPPPEVADICGCSVVVTPQTSTLILRVQLPSSVPAPLCARYCSAVLCCNRVIIHGHFDRLQKRSRFPQQKGALRRGACSHDKLLATLCSVSSAGKSSCLLNSGSLVRVQCGAPFILSRRQVVRHGILVPIFHQFESDRLSHKSFRGRCTLCERRVLAACNCCACPDLVPARFCVPGNWEVLVQNLR